MVYWLCPVYDIQLLTRSFPTLFEIFKHGGEPWLYKNLQTLRQFHTPTPLKGLSFLYS